MAIWAVTPAAFNNDRDIAHDPDAHDGG